MNGIVYQIPKLFRNIGKISKSVHNLQLLHYMRQNKYKSFFSISLILVILNDKNKIIKKIEDKIVINARKKIEFGIEEMKRQYGTQVMTFPQVNTGIRGTRYFMEFLVDQRKCDLFSLLVLILDIFEKNKDDGRIIIKNVSSFKHENVINLQIEFEEVVGDIKYKRYSKGTVSIIGELTYERPNTKLIIENSHDITDLDLNALLQCYREANKPVEKFYKKNNYKHVEINPQTEEKSLGTKLSNAFIGNTQNLNKEEAIKKLEELGVSIFKPNENKIGLDWDYLAGYESQKRDIEDTVLLALTYPEIYDDITKETRVKNEPNRPKAVLFEGPPGTGKTTSAKIIANQVNIPLIYMPIESIMSKFYGESEKRFADIFDACKQLGKAVIFIDEIDSIASSRNFDGIHEASRRILSTLLRKIDSFESTTDVLLICATNRKQDLDQALLSRIDMAIKFELPDKLSRIQIYKRYAKQLEEKELEKLAELSEGLSGRNISDICKDSERRWVSKYIRKEVEKKVPNVEQYLESINSRRRQNLA